MKISEKAKDEPKPKSKPKSKARSDVEPRIKFEDEPEYPTAYETIRQDTYIWNGGLGWKQIGRRYSTTATKRISKDIQEWIAQQEKK